MSTGAHPVGKVDRVSKREPMARQHRGPPSRALAVFAELEQQIMDRIRMYPQQMGKFDAAVASEPGVYPSQKISGTAR